MSDEIETIDKNPKSWAAWKREAERLQAIIDDMALAAMDSEPVIIVGDDGGDALSYRRLIQSFAPGTKLYRHAQPAPVVPGKWIPVSERMPDNTEPVLCIEKRADFGTYGQPFVCWHDGGGWVGKTNYRPIVTHWMPLPAVPQEVKGE